KETQKPADIMKELKNNNVDVTIILLPTGAHKAVKFYAMNALEAGSCVVNGMPSPVVNDPEIVKKAESLNLSLIGDDVKSQIGATIIHRALTNLFPMRGAILDRTIQLDWGGSSDFCNLLTPMPNGELRYEEGKRQSKTESVIANLQNKDEVECQISAVDYIPFLKNQKDALRLSFLMSVPVVIASIIVDIIFGEGSIFGTLDLITIIITTLVSFLTGYITIELLLKLASKINFGYFCVAYGVVAYLVIIPFIIIP
ncbi:unnamed protein product, partial [marine sediment metagenome]